MLYFENRKEQGKQELTWWYFWSEWSRERNPGG